jgi:Ca2+-binding EF-hand superfamily protein
MSRKTLLIAAGVLVATGGLAVAIAQVGPGESRMGDRPAAGEWRDGHKMGGRGHWREGRHRDDFRRRGPRSMTGEQFDTRTRERFARLDQNSDGVIDTAEIEASQKSRGPRAERFGEGFQKHTIARWDADRNGTATKEEFLASVKQRFAAFDLNMDGRITDDDLPPMMRGREALKRGESPMPDSGRRMGRRGGGMMNELRQADANNDGIVALDEVLARATQRFEALDKSKDGSVDQADLDAMRSEMTAYRTQRFLHRYGAVKDGKVTREQFYAKAKEQFAARDLNSDGKLDREDFPGMRGRRHLR